MKDLLGFEDIALPVDPLHNPLSPRYFDINKEIDKIPKQTITKEEYYQAQKVLNKKQQTKTTS